MSSPFHVINYNSIKLLILIYFNKQSTTDLISLILLVREDISLLSEGSYPLDPPSIYYVVFLFLLELNLEIDYASAVLQLDLFSGLICNELIILIFLVIVLFILFFTTALKPALERLLLLLLIRAYLLDLFLPGGYVSDTGLWPEGPVFLLGSHHGLGHLFLSGLHHPDAATFQAGLARLASAVVPVAAVLRAAVQGLAQQAKGPNVLDRRLLRI